MNDNDALAKKLDEMIPKDWDEIVTKNKHMLDVERASDADIAELTAYVESSEVKDTIENYTFIKFVSPHSPRHIRLVGDLSSGRATYTSDVVAIDLRSGLVKTRNSLYAIGVPAVGTPDFHHLIVICSLINQYGYCDVLGVTPFFF